MFMRARVMAATLATAIGVARASGQVVVSGTKWILDGTRSSG